MTHQAKPTVCTIHLGCTRAERTVEFWTQAFSRRTMPSSPSTMTARRDEREAAVRLYQIEASGELGSANSGYWKTAVSVVDIDAERRRIAALGQPVGEVFEVADVARMCHVRDPDGHCIELIERHGTDTVEPRLLLLTLRVRDIGASLAAYRALGLQLYSRQVVSPALVLYFLGPPGLPAPAGEIDGLAVRPWLWAQPHTFLELVHNPQRESPYAIEAALGFGGIEIKGARAPAAAWAEPDGYPVVFSH